MEYDERYEVQNDDIKRRLRSIGQTISEQMPDGWGFGLFLFSYGEGGSMFWISSANRGDVLNALQEFIDREKRNRDSRV